MGRLSAHLIILSHRWRLYYHSLSISVFGTEELLRDCSIRDSIKGGEGTRRWSRWIIELELPLEILELLLWFVVWRNSYSPYPNIPRKEKASAGNPSHRSFAPSCLSSKALLPQEEGEEFYYSGYYYNYCCYSYCCYCSYCCYYC